METWPIQTIATANTDPSHREDSDKRVSERLDSLLAVNAETLHRNSIYASELERFEAGLIKNPLTCEQAFSYFGIMLGTITPAAILTRTIIGSGSFRWADAWFFGIIALVCLISSVAGFFSGKLIGRIVRKIEKLNWLKMLTLLPFIGIFWGLVSGGAGGIIIFVIGAVFGAVLGAIVGTAALPAFTILHRMLKKGDVIERDQFLPLALGISLIISAFILGI